MLWELEGYERLSFGRFSKARERLNSDPMAKAKGGFFWVSPFFSSSSCSSSEGDEFDSEEDGVEKGHRSFYI